MTTTGILGGAEETIGPPPAEPGPARRIAQNLPWRIANEKAGTLPASSDAESVPFADAFGRTLADGIRAAVASPTCDVSAMDGYAVRGNPPWQTAGRILAGTRTPGRPLDDGTAAEIMTGAPVPPGTHAVVPYERATRTDDTVTAILGATTHIRRAGEDARAGMELLPAGSTVTAAVLGLAAQAGLDRLTVHRRPRVRIVVTGDEVLRSGLPAPGQVRDALGPVLTALVNRAGATVTGQVHIGDDARLLRHAIETADADVVAVTGSSSVGVADHLRRVLDDLHADWHVDGVRCRPGHPQALAQLPDGRWVTGLPGNPFAGLVAAMTLLQPLLTALTGTAPRAMPRLPVLGDARPYPGGVRLVPVRLRGACAVVVSGGRSSSMRAPARADALAVIDPDWRDGTEAELLVLP